VWKVLVVTVFAVSSAAVAAAQGTDAPPEPRQDPPPATREALIAQAQAEKDQQLRHYVPSTPERFLNEFESGERNWHLFLHNAYSGGGFPLGVGYARHVSPYNFVDLRGSYTIAGYKRAEVEFVAPRLFNRRATLSALGGWREATEVGFYGVGTDTSEQDRVNYAFRQPYSSVTFTMQPTRRTLVVGGGVELSRWTQRPSDSGLPSVETRYTPAELPGLGAQTTYLHTQGTVGFDWRTSPGYSRRGGFYGVTLHDYNDRDDAFGFQRVDYEAIQHLPILREAWVISLHGRVSTAFDKNNQDIPFFMLPAIGGGSSLRGYHSWRFRDRHSLLLQAEWRIMVNRFMDAAFFYDAGKVTARTSDLDLKGLKSDAGFGVRLHGPFVTPVRIEVAKSREGLTLVLSSSAVF
jgi:hypothetical protein